MTNTTKTVKIATWHNLVAKRHEATLVTPGRPFQAEATAEAREKSARTFGFGTSADEAVKSLMKELKLKPAEVEVVKASETSMVYRGKREHPYNRKSETTEATPAAA